MIDTQQQYIKINIKVVESTQFVMYALEILRFLEFCVMQTPTGLFMKDYSSTLALH
jgi:hypothetical protein